MLPGVTIFRSLHLLRQFPTPIAKFSLVSAPTPRALQPPSQSWAEEAEDEESRSAHPTNFNSRKGQKTRSSRSSRSLALKIHRFRQNIGKHLELRDISSRLNLQDIYIYSWFWLILIYFDDSCVVCCWYCIYCIHCNCSVCLLICLLCLTTCPPVN